MNLARYPHTLNLNVNSNRTSESAVWGMQVGSSKILYPSIHECSVLRAVVPCFDAQGWKGAADSSNTGGAPEVLSGFARLL